MAGLVDQIDDVGVGEVVARLEVLFPTPRRPAYVSGATYRYTVVAYDAAANVSAPPMLSL